MKVCPYCHEEIRDEAIKCRFCLSALTIPPESQNATATQTTGAHKLIFSVDRSLIGPAKVAVVLIAIFLTIGILLYLDGFNFHQPGPGPDQATYIVDKGLLRFAKFAGAMLGAFITVGVFLYGFNLKEVGKEIREIDDNMKDLYRKATSTNDDIRKSMVAVAAERTESENLLKQTRDLLASTEIEKQKIVEVADQSQQRLIQSQEQVDRLLKRGESSLSEWDKQFHSMVKEREPARARGAGKKLPAAATRHFTVPELARIYEFPPECTGRGQCIGLIELGGGYKDSDLKTYFGQLGLPVPKVTWESVDGAKNEPTGPGGPDMQVTLDIEVVGAVAPDAHIVVYFAPNTNDGFLSAVEKAVADDINRPSVISISWGAPEANWTEEVMHSFDEAFQAAAAIGITVVCAAGDNGVTDGLDDGQAHVDFPASSPSVLACGGTRLTASELKVRSEVVWNDGNSGTGGGVSNVFALPEWQSKTNVPAAHTGHQGRGIPDVAANASPETGYSIYAHGRSVIVGGTAAATPLWAGLIALLNEGVGRNIGNIHSVLYDSIGPEGVLRAITEGHNGLRGVKGYVAGPGWNACAGWGSPNGMKLLQALRSHFRTAIDDDSTSTAADS